jgi:HD superfamily phosphodiesterase
LNGEKDEQVDPKANLAAIKTIFTKNKNTHYKTYEVPGVNHLFQHCKACGSVSEYLALEETFDKATLVMIGDWIREQVK